MALLLVAPYLGAQECPVAAYQKWKTDPERTGFYVGAYRPTWQACINNIQPQASWEAWTAANYACQGVYDGAYVRNDGCTRGNSGGYCVWRDGDHQDSVYAIKECPPCTSFDLALQAGGTVEAGQSLTNQSATLKCMGQPARGILLSVESSTATPPKGTLQPAAIEQASCTGGETLACTTDDDGTIQFQFNAPPDLHAADVIHQVVARCSNGANNCVPNPTSPSAITVPGCPVSLNVSVPSNRVGPAQVLGSFLVVARDCRGQSVPNLALTLSSTVEPSSGFHYLHASGRPLCTTAGAQVVRGSSIACTTGSGALGSFEFAAPQFAGVHHLTVQCSQAGVCSEAVTRDVNVMVENLQLISTGIPIGQPTTPGARDTHPDRHYLAPQANAILKKIARRYAQIVGEAICVNDASLPWGGVFDTGANWSEPHQAHSCGTGVDIAGKINAGYPYQCEVAGTAVTGLVRQATFESIYKRWNVLQETQHTNHYHLYLLAHSCPN